MSELLLKGLGLVLMTGIIAELLKQFGSKAAPCVISLALVGSVSIFGEVLSSFSEQIIKLSEFGNLSRYAEGVLKIIAVGLLSGVVSDIVGEISGNLLSKAVVTVGKCEIFCICLPFLNEIIETGISLVSSG